MDGLDGWMDGFFHRIYLYGWMDGLDISKNTTTTRAPSGANKEFTSS